MKLTVFLILISVAGVLANKSYSQTKVLNLNMREATVKEVLNSIEKQSEFYFLYSENLIDVNRKVDVTIENQKIEHALKLIFAGTDVEYSIRDRIIVLTTPEVTVNDIIIQQQKTVSGMVTDETGEPLTGVTVMVKGTTTGTVTDGDGNFSLTIPIDAETLQFSFVGMRTQEVAVDGRTTFMVVLEVDAIGIEEVIAVGYGTQKKINVIGSVAQISSDELSESTVPNVSNALAGRLPGAIVQQRSGEPGYNAANILIRGSSTLNNNSPLIVIDGVQGRDLNSLNMNDVESISILKDASAAIYGSRASNGVIIVTTKDGKINKPLSLTYDFYQGLNTPTKLAEMTDAPTYSQMIRESQSYLGISEQNMTFSEEDIEKFRSGEYLWTHPNTNGYDALAKYSGISNHNFAVSGGTENVTYYGSFGALYEEGIYTNNATSFNRYNFKMNLDYKVNKYFDMKLYSSGYKEKGVYPSTSSVEIFRSIQEFVPTSVMEWPNGLPGPPTLRDQPKVMSSFEYGRRDDDRYRLDNTIYATLKIPGLKGLSLSGYYSYDIIFNKQKTFTTPGTLYELDITGYFAAGNTGKEDGTEFLIPTSSNVSEPRLNESYSNNKNITTHLKLEYVASFKDVHNVSAFVAYETLDIFNEGLGAFRRYFISDKLPYMFAGGNESQNISNSVGLDASVNYFGRFNYDYNETYLFQFTFRRDGSLRFSEESGRWGNFPSVLVGYRPSSQNWWKNSIGFIDYFKLKASYGQLGNDLISPFQYLANYVIGSGIITGENRDYNFGLRQSGVPNPDITWEVANMYNIGWESQFLNNKIKFDADFFYERRKNILTKRSASVPGFTGIILSDENFGIVDNKGLELVLGFEDRLNDFNYSINGNFTFVRNEIIDYDEPERNVPWQVRTGLPQGTALVYRKLGVFRDEEHVNSYPHVQGAIPGDLILEDFDGDGEITSDDKILLTTSRNPEIVYGISLNFGFRNWQLSGLLQGVGNTQARIFYHLQGLLSNYYQHVADDRWTPDNINTNQPRAVERQEAYWRKPEYMSDHFYHSMDYIRLKNLRITYTIPKNFTDRIYINSAQVYLSSQNPLLIYSSNKVMDPETGFEVHGTPGGWANYPVMKTFALGVKVNF